MQELAQALTGRGHQVTVLTGFPNYPSGELYPRYRLRCWQREILSGIPVVRVPLYPDHSRSGLRRALNYLSFAVSAALLGPCILSRPDVIFVYHPPLTVGLPAWVLSRLWGTPFVYQIQDMWPETLSATGMLNNPYILDGIGWFAKWIYARAAAICVISPGFCVNLVEKGVPQDKIHVISNWVDTITYRPESPDLALAEKLSLTDKFNVMFAGNIGEAQGLDVLLAAAERLCDLPAVQFVVVGDGVALPELRRIVESKRLKNIRFLGRYPVSSMSALYALANVLLVHLRDDPLFRMTIPHKIFAYLASGKPILAAVTGDAAVVVQDAGAGLVCVPQNPDALAATVRQFYALPQAKRDEMGKRGLNAVHTKYDREFLIDEIEAVLKSAAGF
jgi:colanic acid biosynthesis glycosyl transferase WcaI